METVLHIVDVAGCSLKTHLSSTARELFSRIANSSDVCYPETLGKLIIINTSKAFPVFWGFMKGFLDSATRARIEIFGAAPSPRDFFQPGGWPARLKQLLGYFPDVRAASFPTFPESHRAHRTHRRDFFCDGSFAAFPIEALSSSVLSTAAMFEIAISFRCIVRISAGALSASPGGEGAQADRLGEPPVEGSGCAPR